jgi:hypothetical protein
MSNCDGGFILVTSKRFGRGRSGCSDSDAVGIVKTVETDQNQIQCVKRSTMLNITV